MEDDEARDLWFASYVRNWLERDVTELARIEDAPDLRRVLLATAARTGALLNQAEVARDASTARTTAHRYLALFAIGRLLDLLPAYSRNLSVRVIKAPRVFWRDAALAAHLVGGRARRKLRELPHWGCLLENLVLANLRAWASTRGSAVELYYWRTAGGREVDFVVEIEDRTIPIEIKATVRPTTADSRHLQEFVSTYRRRCPYGVLLHGGDSIETPVPGVVAAPILSVL
jgi:predicted AAA+ superfamily ATPase